MDQLAINNKIAALILKHPKSVADHYWVRESLRYEELLFSLLYATFPEKPKQCRSAIQSLRTQDLLDPMRDILAKNNKIENALTLSTLERCGFSKTEAKNALSIIMSCADIICKNYQGKIQYLLRIFGEVLRNELLLTFRKVPMTKPDLKLGLSLWMQNALNMPLSIENPDILEFCKENKISLDQLTRAADELDINIALLDDIIIAHRQKKLKSKIRKNKTRSK